MPRPLLWGGLLLVLCVAYLAMLPATWFDYLLQRESEGTLGMTATHGTLWRGEGTLQALLPNGDVTTLAAVSWKIAIPELLMLRLHVTAQSTQNGSPVLDAMFRPGETRVQTAHLDLPAALLGVLSPTLREANLSGQMAISVNDVHLVGNHATGGAMVMWQDAGSGLTRIRPLGNYQFAVNGQGDGLDFNLVTLGGALLLEGSGRWVPYQKTQYRLTATPQQASRKDLEPMLRMLGREIRPGTYQLTIQQGMGAVSG
jgi:general secretion pathway protein N